jgi:uncharacterized OB-fold protein
VSRIAPQIPAELSTLHVAPYTAPFWEAALEHRLVAQRCPKCGEFRMPPSPFCWACRAHDADWVELPGTGTVFTYNVTRKALLPLLADMIPYVVAVVDLDGAPGARLVSNLLDIDPDDVRIGMRVKVAWDDIHERTTIPRFVPLGTD